MTAPTKADPYKDLSEAQRARVEKALAKAQTKPTVPQDDPHIEEDLATPATWSGNEHNNGSAPVKPEPITSEEASETNGTEVATAEPDELEGEVVGELVTSRTEPIRRTRAAKTELRKQNTHYQVCEPLATDDMEALRKSVLANGIMVPVIIDTDGMVLDGHNRVNIAVDNDLPIPFLTVDLETDAEKRALAWELNRARRQMSPEQKAEIRWQKIVVEGRPVAEVAKELGETPETSLRNVRKDAEKHVPDPSADDDGNDPPAPPEVLTPTEQQRRKIVDAHTDTPDATDADIAKRIGAPKATVNRVRKTLKAGKPAEKVVKNKTAPKPTIHDDFAKAVTKLSKAADDVVRLSQDSRAARSGAKLWEANGQEMVAILNRLNEIAAKLSGEKGGKK